MTKTRNISKAVNMIILREMKAAGELEGLTLQDVADLLQMGHRATAMRALHSLPVLEAELQAVRERLKSANQ